MPTTLLVLEIIINRYIRVSNLERSTSPFNEEKRYISKTVNIFSSSCINLFGMMLYFIKKRKKKRKIKEDL